MGCIYGIRNEVNHKWYIGKCNRPVPEKRRDEHFNGRGSQELKDDIDEYGVENFTFHILHDGIIPELLDNYEIETIAKYNSVVPSGYNKTKGGSRGEYSDESRLKMSESVKRTFAENPEIWKESQKNATEAAAKHNTGRTYSEEHRQAISKANKGRKSGKPAHNKNPIWYDTETIKEIVRLYTTELKSCREIGDIYNIQKTLVGNILKSNGVKLVNHYRKKKRSDIWNHQGDVITLYTVHLKTTKEISNIFNVTPSTVLKVLKSNNIKLINTNKVNLQRNQGKAIHLYAIEMKSVADVAKVFKVDQRAIRQVLSDNNIPTRPIGSSTKGKSAHNRSDAWKHQDKIIKLYTEELLSLKEIGKMFDVCPGSISNILKSNNIKLRTGQNQFATTRASYSKHAKELFLSLSIAMDISEKRKILRENFPDVERSTIYYWVRKWQSENG